MSAESSRAKQFPYILLEVPPELEAPLTALVWESPILGVEESGEDGSIRLKVFFESPEAAAECRSRIAAELPGVSLSEAGEVRIDDWISLLHGGFEPVAVGPFLVVPAGPPPPPTKGSRLLRINPGLGFGTGTHSTTRLTFELLCELARPGISVLDLGTGSGILAVGAAMIGAGRVLGLDTDADAVDNARQNLRLNGVEGLVELREGSIEAAAGMRFDLVLANILAPTLVKLFASGLADLVAPGGDIVLSGFAPADEIKLLACTRDRGLRKIELRSEGEWAALHLRRDN